MANPSCIPEIYSYHLQYNPEGFTVISIELLASWWLKYIKCYLSEHFLLASTYQSQIIKLIATAEHKRTQGLTFPYNLLCFSTCDTMILMHGVITACHASLHEWQGILATQNSCLLISSYMHLQLTPQQTIIASIKEPDTISQVFCTFVQ